MKKTPLKRKTPLRAKMPKFGEKRRDIANATHRGIRPLKSNTAPRKHKKKSDLAKLKVKLWKLCREIQIARYGRTCYTCGAKDLQGSNCHLGHFIPSSVCSTEMRYDLDNLKPCCYHCNINLSGNWIEYEKHLIRDGVDVQELKDRNEKTKGGMYREDWYETKLEHYKNLL